MSFKYEIDTKLGNSDQVGLRLQCNGQNQAEQIHRGLRQAGFQVTKLMASKHSGYTHFVYITSTETELRNAMLKIEANIRALVAAGDVKVGSISQEIKVPNAQNFKLWKNQFRKAVKKLNSDSPRTTSSVQEIDRNRLEQQIAAGRTTEVEEQLLRQANINDSNTLRELIALYARTEQSEKLVELCKSRPFEVLALPVSGRMVEQLVSTHLQHYQQTNTLESLRAAKEFAQEFLPELERLRQANGVRQLLHQPLISQEPLPTVEGATLGEQLVRLLEIEPGERILHLEPLKNKYPKATNVLLALAESYAAIDKTEEALKIYQSFPEQTDEIKQRCAELLLASQRFQEVIELLPPLISDLSPTLAGLRGAALYNSGQKTQAREFLEKAWQGGERIVQILLPLARLWATVGDSEKAGAVYQVLQETANKNLTLEDYIHIAVVANMGGFGDIDGEQKIVYYEQCLSFAETHLFNLPMLEDILKERLDLSKSVQNAEKLVNAYADFLDWFANLRSHSDT